MATRCQILRLKYTKFDFGWGSAPVPGGEACIAPPDSLAGFKGDWLCCSLIQTLARWVYGMGYNDAVIDEFGKSNRRLQFSQRVSVGLSKT